MSRLNLKHLSEASVIVSSDNRFHVIANAQLFRSKFLKTELIRTNDICTNFLKHFVMLLSHCESLFFYSLVLFLIHLMFPDRAKEQWELLQQMRSWCHRQRDEAVSCVHLLQYMVYGHSFFGFGYRNSLGPVRRRV